MRGSTSATETRSTNPDAGPRWSPRGVVVFLAAAAGAGAVTLGLWAADYPYADLQRGYARMLAVAGVLTSIVLFAVSTTVRRATERSGLARVGVATAVVAAGALTGWASGTALLEWSGASDDDVEPPRGGAGPAPTPPAATQRAGPAGPTPPVDVPVTCDGDTATGDVDGDGAADQVMHRVVRGAAVLQVCLADGRADQLPGLGQAEVLQLLDIDGDGQIEIAHGASSAAAAWAWVAVWHDGALVPVTLSGSEEVLELARGGTGTFDGDRWSAMEAWGCTDLDHDGERELVTARADLVDDHYEATFTGHVVRDGRATVTTRTDARLPVSSDPFAGSDLGECR